MKVKGFRNGKKPTNKELSEALAVMIDQNSYLRAVTPVLFAKGMEMGAEYALRTGMKFLVGKKPEIPKKVRVESYKKAALEMLEEQAKANGLTLNNQGEIVKAAGLDGGEDEPTGEAS